MKKILILAANPIDTNKLRLDEEVREIENAHRQGQYREEIEIIVKLAVRVEDLQNELLHNNPNVIHFCGHGEGCNGLVMENKNGLKQLVSSKALADLFNLFEKNIECVVLNACYSEVQARAIYQYINCVVGMDKAIGDKPAIKFATGFYRALVNGRNYQESFNFGCNAIDLESIPESDKPQIKIKDNSKGLVSVVTTTKPIVKREKVFISYSREDKEWLEKLQIMLKPLEEIGKISVWDNTKIKAGEIREEAIRNALAEAKIAVLLVSANYLASHDVKQQLLPLLKAAEQEGLKIIWIYVSYCFVDETDIYKYQPAHDISQPLYSLSPADVDQVLLSIAKEIREAANS